MAPTSRTTKDDDNIPDGVKDDDVFVDVTHKSVKLREGEPPPRMTRGTLKSWASEAGWSEVKGTASVDATPSGGADSDAPTS